MTIDRESMIEDALEDDRCGICWSTEHFIEDHAESVLLVSNQLEREASRTARVLRTGAEIDGLFGVFWLTQWTLGGAEDVNLLLRVLGCALGFGFTRWMSVRWSRRAAWYRTTPFWWLHLDSMPPVVPFPKLIDFFDRPLFGWRKK